MVATAMHEAEERDAVSVTANTDTLSLGDAYSGVKSQFSTVERHISGTAAEATTLTPFYRMVARATELTMVVMDMADLYATPEAARSLALGVYTEEEGSYDDQHGKADMWRDESIYAPTVNTDIYRHLKHEVLSELKTNMNGQNIDFLLHNSADALGLAAILVAAIKNRRDSGAVE